MTIGPEPLGPVPASHLTLVSPTAADCAPVVPVGIPARYGPRLSQGPLTQAGRLPAAVTRGGQTSATRPKYDPAAPAREAMRWALADVVPDLALHSSLGPTESDWDARRDLLSSNANALDFVVETESDGSAAIRFGDGRSGARPAAGTTFEATYRIGNGSAGNVAPDSLFHVVTAGGIVVGARNPLPAAGGTEPEPIADVRRFAPVAFRTQERAVTADDYARVAERQPEVQKAAASFRWTGSWRTVFVTADPKDGPTAGAVVGAGDAGISSSRTGWQATISTSTRRATCHSRSTCTVCATARLLPIRGQGGSPRRVQQPSTGRRSSRASSTRTTSRSAARSTCRACTPRPMPSPASSRSTISRFERQGHPDPLPLLSGQLEFAPAGDRPTGQQPGLPGARRPPDRRGGREMSPTRDPSLRHLDDCGCCTGIAAATPAVVENRPGLSAIAYRSGTWHDFKQSMLAALQQGRPPRAGGARDACGRRRLDRVPRCGGDGRRCPHVLQRESRERVVPADRHRAAVDPRARPTDRLPAQARVSRRARWSRSRSKRHARGPRHTRPPRSTSA